MQIDKRLENVFSKLKQLLSAYERGDLVVIENTPGRYELEFDKDYYTYSEKTGKHTKKRGMYFAGLVLYKTYVGFYFMPIYSHRDQFNLSAMLKPLLRGKSCFHFKELDDELKSELSRLIEKGCSLYTDWEGMIN